MLRIATLTIAIYFVIYCITCKCDTDEEWYLKKMSRHEAGQFSASTIHVLRLAPNEDLLDSLWKYARVTKIKAASIVSAVGSLTTANIRYANQESGTVSKGYFEITSLVGNIDFQKSSSFGYGHVHIAISNSEGLTYGGHLMTGSIVYTTVEITFLEINDAIFDRTVDDGPDGSGYYELKVFNSSNPN
jgi:hypothetical protein